MTIEEISKKVEKKGGKVYLVGGAIRDSILGRNITDEDYCITGLSSYEFMELFPTAKKRGKSFEVFDLENKEFALARRETKTEEGHRGFEIETNKNINIEDDLKRRDITINAIAQEVLTKKIIDPFKGQEDINNKIIRATTEKFKEDPLRVYRVARFAAELEFTVEAKTLKMMNSLKEELQTLSKERVFNEFRKALNTDKPSIFFEVLKASNVLDIHFKEIADLIGALQPEKYHPEGDAYNHTVLALDNSAKITKNEKVRFATLVHDLGKGQTPEEMYPHHYNHEERGIEPLKRLCKNIGVPKAWEQSGKTAIKEHMKAGQFYRMTASKKVSFIEKIEKSELGIEGMQIVVYSDRARNCEEAIKDNRYNFRKVSKDMLKQIDGKYIERKYKELQGEKFGQKLHRERVAWIKEYYKQ